MTVLMFTQKLTGASLIYCTEPKTKTRKMNKLKNKNGYAQKKRWSQSGWGRKSRVEMICGTGRFLAWSETATE